LSRRSHREVACDANSRSDLVASHPPDNSDVDFSVILLLFTCNGRLISGFCHSIDAWRVHDDHTVRRQGH